VSAVAWFTGLPASGKSTLARHVREACAPRRPAIVLDGDALRPLLAPGGGFDDEARERFYEALSGLAALVAGQGVIALVAATAHRRAWRARARALAPRFVEVFVDTPLAVCEARDPRGLYARARSGGAPLLPGVGAPYEPPDQPDVVARGGEDPDAIVRVVQLVAP
jgi:adenylylsulfate kinase